MHKRDFLKVMGALLLGARPEAMVGQAQGSPRVAAGKRIVVIGAGLAGLAAARALQNQGYDVRLVEARDRIGGRAWTSTHWADMPLDLGASWIHGVKGNPLTQLANEVQAGRLVTEYDKSRTYNTEGRPLSEAGDERVDELRKRVRSALAQAQERRADASIAQVVEPLLREVGESSEAARIVRFLLNSEIEQEYAGSITRLSAQWYDNTKDFEGDDALLAQGYRVLTEYVARSLPMELGQVVKEIHWRDAPVRVVTQRAEFVADRVVVTLPLGVLQAKKIRFSPELPADKQDAIARLGMGVLNKCCLRFAKAFWPADVDWIEYVARNPGEWTEWVSLSRTAHWPVLLGFNAADQGRKIEAWSDRQIVADAMRTLRTIYGAGIPDPVDYQITRWASDPFALGAYSFNAVGSTPALRTVLAAPVAERLYFAGEATEKDYFGTAHGAYLSGLRAAAEIAGT